MTHSEAAREWMLSTALTYLGKPYIWGGDDPSGFDCSGLVVECLRSVGLIDRSDLTADQLYRRLRSHEVEEPEAACLIFWLNTSGVAYHVGICLDRWHQISAGGGDRTTLTESDAWTRNAYIRIRPLPASGTLCRYCNPLRDIKE